MKSRYNGARKGPRKFFILNGVRRALASREAGRRVIPAVVYQEGRAPAHCRLRLSQLYSPRSTVAFDARFAAIQPPIREPIEVEPLGSRGQQSSVPLSKVRIS